MANKRETESLTKAEINRIKKMATGYGKFRDTAEKAGLPVPTLRDIIHKGYAIPENIRKIRENLFSANVELETA